LFDHLDGYNRVADLFDRESDRAAAILAASFLETLLEKLLKATFVGTPSTDMSVAAGRCQHSRPGRT
jgi:hypothetical protein